MKTNKHRWLVACLIFSLFLGQRVYADSSNSNNYRVDQTFFGSGGVLDAQSNAFRSRQTLGEVGAGNTQGTLFQAYAGFNTTDEPYIEMYVDASFVNLGALDSSSASVTEGSFYVRAWQAEGYAVRSESEPPRNTGGPYSLAPMSAGGTSSPGTEQFGINLVENPDFCSGDCLGEPPQQIPDNTFSTGNAAAGYDTPNNFRYNKSEIIARSDQSTSVTIYTISYLFNISPATPAGDYRFDHNLVATGTY